MCRLLELVQEGRLDIVAVWRYDRLSRDNLDVSILLGLFRKHGVGTFSVTEPAPGTDDPTGVFVVHMLGLLATLELKQIALRMKMGMRARTRNWLWHGGPRAFLDHVRSRDRKARLGGRVRQGHRGLTSSCPRTAPHASRLKNDSQALYHNS